MQRANGFARCKQCLEAKQKLPCELPVCVFEQVLVVLLRSCCVSSLLINKKKAHARTDMGMQTNTDMSKHIDSADIAAGFEKR